MIEADIRKHLIKRVSAHGGLVEKRVPAGRRGPPDEIVTWPWGAMDLVETKRPKGGKVEPWQKRDHEMRAKLCVPVYLLWTIQDVEDYVKARIVLRHAPHLFSVPVA